jgi:hypothetical protein
MAWNPDLAKCDRCGQPGAIHQLVDNGKVVRRSCPSCWYLVCEEWATGTLVMVGKARPEYVALFTRRQRV